MSGARVVVVGGGIAGLASAWWLVQRGVRELVLVEREPLLGTHSTGRNAAILRTPQPDALGEQLALEGARFLRRPPRGFAEHALLDPCGLVLLADAPRLAEWERRLERRADARALAPEELARLAPHWRREAQGTDARAWWLPDEGRIDVAALVEGFARGLRAGGARLELGCGVRSLARAASGTWRVRLEDERVLEAERVVLAAGGWAARLGGAAGSRVRLEPTRRHLVQSAPDTRVDPRWPITWSEADGFYARPESGGLLLCACDQVTVDPDRLVVVDEVVEQALAKAARCLSALPELGLARAWAGVRTLTADGRFALGADPELDGLLWAAGLGGHGISSAAAVGRIVAAATLGEALEPELARALAPGRLARAERDTSEAGRA